VARRAGPSRRAPPLLKPSGDESGGARRRPFHDFHDFRDLEPLRVGTEVQRAAVRALERCGVLEVLAPFRPVLTSTVVLDVDLPGSDLDLACEAPDLDAFDARLAAAFGSRASFTARRRIRDEEPREASVVAFEESGFVIEAFGCAQPVERQASFRHLDVHARLLAIGGDEARARVRAAKREGRSTEEAFARCFSIEGEARRVLLELSERDDEALRRAIRWPPGDAPARG